MRHEYSLPKLADTANEYVLLEWKVAVGDVVRRDQPLAVVETDKTEVELDVPVDGTVAEVLVADGDDVTTGQVICVFDTEP